MPNQYTKAVATGKEKPAGANQFTTGKREKHDQSTIDKIRAERAAQVAEEIMDAKGSSPEQRLAAAKLLLPFGKSTLQSIESKEVALWDAMSEEELLALGKALITSHPELIANLNLAPKPARVGDQTVVSTSQAAL